VMVSVIKAFSEGKGNFLLSFVTCRGIKLQGSGNSPGLGHSHPRPVILSLIKGFYAAIGNSVNVEKWRE
jgi:hypothetical protein